jgi:putative membrane protein
MGKFSEYILTAVKGACMGAADVIPGVSGGTIAFIMGIYDKFVASLAAINAEAVKLFFTGKFKEFWRHINGGFLLSLVVGIGVSVISLATVMQTLLSDFPIQTWAFFFGLIVASSIFILRGISGWGLREILFLIGGILLGVTICTLSPTQTPDALWFIFLSGAIAICAMILPGISGSFILLILGKYQYIMGVISGLASGQEVASNLVILGVFLIGAAVGIIAFSKFLHWLLARWHKETLIALAGFIIGSLVKVWPWSNTEAIVCSQFPEVAALAQAAETAAEVSPEAYDSAMAIYEGAVAANTSMIEPQIASAVIFAIIGFSLVTGIEFAGKLLSKNKIS